VLLLAACGGNGAGQSGMTAPLPDRKPQKPVKIGMLLSLSGFGPQAATAKGMKQGAELALFELDNPLVQLVVKDDHGSPEGAAAAARDAIGEGAEILVGPLTAQGASAVAPVARQAKVAVLTFSNDRRIAGNGVYLMSFLPEQEIDRIIGYAASQGKRRFAALVPDDAYGHVIEPEFRRVVEQSGGLVVALSRYPLEANAMLSPVRALADEIKQAADSAAPVDALLVAGGAESLPQIDPLLTYAGLGGGRIQLLGTGGWDYADAGRNPALVGGWYPGPDPHGWTDFVARFSRAFGQAPPRLASLAYDAVGIAIALSSAEPGQRYTAEMLTRPSGFSGVDGILRFGADGLPDRALAVLALESFGGHVIAPAPGAGVPETAASGSGPVQ